MPKIYLENIADNTWQNLRDGIAFDVSQGEETISDNILLYLAKLRFSNLRLLKTPKDLEFFKGTDWEWWIGNDKSGWLRYAVQAKKLNAKTLSYMKLNHKVSNSGMSRHPGHTIHSRYPHPLWSKLGHPIYQHDILLEYSKLNSAIPLYAFYNFIELKDYRPSWNCRSTMDVSQLGITVTP